MVETISVHQAADIIAKHEVDVIDVRDVAEWCSGHIPGARVVPLDQLRTDPDAIKHDGVMFVCAKGVRSLSAAKLAERLGYSKLYNLEGGTSAWARAGLPLEKTEVAKAA
jgi:rhodanese-related sulfurtransferase